MLPLKVARGQEAIGIVIVKSSLNNDLKIVQVSSP